MTQSPGHQLRMCVEEEKVLSSLSSYISISIYPSLSSYNFSILVMRNFNIYSLSNSQIYTTVLAIVTMPYTIYPGLIYLITGSLYLLTTFTHFSHPTSYLYVCEPPPYSFLNPQNSNFHYWAEEKALPCECN